MIVDIPGVGQVEFPDSMSEADISAAAKKLHAGAAPAAQQKAGDRNNPIMAGIRGAAQGLTFGTSDEIGAFVRSKVRGEDYEDALAHTRGMMADDREQHGVASVGGEIAGMLLPATALGRLAMAGRSGWGSARMGAALGGAEGAAYGFGTGQDGLKSRLANAGKDATIGAGVGAAAVPVASAVRSSFNAVADPLMGAVGAGNTSRANRAVSRAMSRSGRTADDLDAELTQAAREGQPEYVLADALGNPGQRMLAGVARQPGNARTAVVEALEGRQGSQGRRLAGQVADALGAPDTAKQRVAGLTAARNDAASTSYDAARGNAAPVDVRGALAAIDSRIGGMQGSGVSGDSIDGMLSGFRARLAGKGADGARRELSDFNRVLGVKQDIQDAIGKAVRAGEGNKARELGKLAKELDAALEDASPSYRTANDQYREASRVIDAVETGQGMASPRSRVADNLDRYGAMTPDQQASARAGYADPLIGKIEGAAPGVNKARPLLADDVQLEFGAMARDPDLLKRQVGRENTMFETRHAASGGSRTADNLADMMDANAPGGLLDAAVSAGNLQFGQAARGVARAVAPHLTGNNEGTRELIAKALMSRNPQAVLSQITNQADKDAVYSAILQALVRSGGRVAAP